MGKNLQDRLFLELVIVQDPRGHHRRSYVDSPAALEQARKQWMTSQSGPLSDYYLPQMISYLRSDSILSSQEFKNLDSETQHFMRAEMRPFYEMMSVSLELLSFNISIEENNLAWICIFDNNKWDVPESSGESKVIRVNEVCILILES